MDKSFLRKNGALLILIAIFITIIIIAASAIHHQHQRQKTIALYLPEVTLARNNSTQRSDSKPRAVNWQKVVVQSGDTLKSIFGRNHLQRKDLWAVLKLQDNQLSLLKPGQHIFILKNDRNQLVAIRYPLSPKTTLLIHRHNNRLNSKIVHLPITTNLSFKSATIYSSLAEAAHKVGLNHKMYRQLQKIFQGKINFARDLRTGDHFAVLYKEYYINGERYRTGDIVAAEFVNRGKKYRVVRYNYPKNHSGYYTPEGHGIEPLFLKAPLLHYSRISSRFSYHRFDPVLHRYHTHLGVDYAANTGTPIRSIGDGRVVFIGHDGGYGNAIKIRYGRHYQGLYAHMWRFAKNIKIHQRVRKGQVIGYVGSSGWSTGHHLHFGFYIDGIPHDWLAFKQPYNAPIPRLYRAHFAQKAKRLFAALNLYQATELAANTTKPLDTSS